MGTIKKEVWVDSNNHSCSRIHFLVLSGKKFKLQQYSFNYFLLLLKGFTRIDKKFIDKYLSTSWYQKQQEVS